MSASSSRISSSCSRALLGALSLCVAGPGFAAPPSPPQFATSVASFAPGVNANPAFPAANALGGPTGGGLTSGSSHVCVLGAGGSLVLQFASGIADGPGADFVTYENGLMFGGGLFTELAFVEVSTDGSNFARLHSRTIGPMLAQPTFGTLPLGTFSGLLGASPCVANVNTNVIDPRDCAAAGGDAFDLAELAADPLVATGLLDLADVRFVRMLDVQEGMDTDASGTPIFDHGGITGSADVDAVAVIHTAALVPAEQPVADFSVDAQGRLELRLGHPQGLARLDLATLQASWNLQPLPLDALFSGFQLVSFDGAVAHLRTPGPVTGVGLLGVLGLSVKDLDGRISGDRAALQR